MSYGGKTTTLTTTATIVDRVNFYAFLSLCPIVPRGHRSSMALGLSFLLACLSVHRLMDAYTCAYIYVLLVDENCIRLYVCSTSISTPEEQREDSTRRSHSGNLLLLVYTHVVVVVLR